MHLKEIELDTFYIILYNAMSTTGESPGLKPWPLVWTILLGHVIITDYMENI